jgi:predicted metal-binding protein
MRPLDYYCKRALELRIDDAKPIDPRSVVTAEWVRMKCQFGCRHFGLGLCCPPHTPTPGVTRRVIDSYERAILLHRRLKKDEKEELLNEPMVLLEIEMFIDGYYKAWSMGSGPCRLCKECNMAAGCKRARKARPSMEACGIDVFKTARDNGFHIEVARSKEEERSSYGLILAE